METQWRNDLKKMYEDKIKIYTCNAEEMARPMIFYMKKFIENVEQQEQYQDKLTILLNECNEHDNETSCETTTRSS